ncbi:ATP-binding cassette domain-containing protein [Candidatus Pelagibacter sp.]|nr:ATP-binding cassette domain-containing protein [Candidatus Pelagibacter sp.]
MTLTIQNLSFKFPYKSKKKSGLFNINLEINKGEKIGLIGNNGSGKSTLLRIIARIYSQDTGTIKGSKKIYSIFNFNSGIDPELNGIQNIYRMAIIRQIERGKIDSNISDLVDFTDLKEKIYDPVFTYSKGMKIRLGISLLNVVTPKIIIFDEGLGAGDMQFINKVRKLIDFKIKESAISFIATHSMKILNDLTTRSLVLDRGRIIYDGSTNDAVKLYQKMKI